MNVAKAIHVFRVVLAEPQIAIADVRYVGGYTYRIHVTEYVGRISGYA